MSQTDEQYEAELVELWAGMRRTRRLMWAFVIFAAALILVEAAIPDDGPIVRVMIVGAFLYGMISVVRGIADSEKREMNSRMAWDHSRQMNAMESDNLQSWIDHNLDCHRPT